MDQVGDYQQNKHVLAALQKGARSQYRLNDWHPSNCFIEEHFCISDIKLIPVRCNRGRVNLDVRVEMDDERRERFRKGVKESRIIESRSRRLEVIREIISVQPRWDCELSLQSKPLELRKEFMFRK
jgi:hypothetical protein